jgi:hypothetical protein
MDDITQTEQKHFKSVHTEDIQEEIEPKPETQTMKVFTKVNGI